MGILTDKIHSSKFDISKKGYDKEQVDEFLDNMILELERIEKESAEQKEEIAKFRDMQDGMARAMVSVQSAADKLLDEAKIKAEVSRRESEEYAERTRREADAYRDKTIAQAKRDAETILREKQQEYNDLSAEIGRLSEFVHKFREAIRSDIQSFAEALDKPQSSVNVFKECPELMNMNADQSKGDSVDEAAVAEEEKPLYVDDVMKQVEEAAEADSTEEEETGEAGAEQKDQADDPLFDLGDIMKNLPETDSELKAMIDEMI